MRALSLMYHDVVTSGDPDASGFGGGDAAIYKLDKAQFTSHLEAITEAVEAAGIGRPQTTEALAKTRRGEDVVVLHFDDGGASALHIADELERFGWRGYFHITSERIGSTAFVSQADIRALHERSHIIGSHSRTHPARISSLPRDDIRQEWTDSVNALADIVGTAVTVASVPGGFCSREVIETADEAGIEILFNSEPTSHFDWIRGCMVLGRYSIKRATPAAEAAAMAVGQPAPRWRQWALWNGKKVLKRAGGKYWLAARKRLLS